MDVRTMRTDDLDAALTPWEATEHLGRVPRKEVESAIAFGGDLLLVAEREGRLVGVVLGTFDGRRGTCRVSDRGRGASRRPGGVGRAGPVLMPTSRVADRVAGRATPRASGRVTGRVTD
jgi:hypothetical protein